MRGKKNQKHYGKKKDYNQPMKHAKIQTYNML